MKTYEDGGVITIPKFSRGHAVCHFFGTRHHPSDLQSPFADIPFGSAPSPIPRAVVSVKQVHGTEALLVDRPVEPGTTFAGSWDAIITNQPGVLITVRTADCVPVLMYDPVYGVVAAIHSGWRGSVAGIVPKTLTRMERQYGSPFESVQVAIGPSAGSCCYEVDSVVLKPLQSYPFWDLVVRESSARRALLDLRAFLRYQLVGAGVPESNIRLAELCTICQPGLFYSYRREGQVNGTMSSGIMLLNPDHRGPRTEGGTGLSRT